MRYGTYPYNLEQLLNFNLVDTNIKKSKLQSEHNRICSDAQLHLKTLHNLTGDNRCPSNSNTELAHRKVAYLFNILHDDGKQQLSKEIGIQCWLCFYFNNNHEIKDNLDGMARFEKALYALCKECAYSDIAEKITKHDPQGTGFFHKKAHNGDLIYIFERSQFNTLCISYNGNLVAKELFETFNEETKNNIERYITDNGYNFKDLLK